MEAVLPREASLGAAKALHTLLSWLYYPSFGYKINYLKENPQNLDDSLLAGVTCCINSLSFIPLNPANNI